MCGGGGGGVGVGGLSFGIRINRSNPFTIVYYVHVTIAVL